MTPAIVALLAMTLGFTLLVVWAYWPGRKAHWDDIARAAIADERDEVER